MTTICDADLHHLKPGKKVMLKSYDGSTSAPDNVEQQRDYWKLIGSKGSVASQEKDNRVLIQFEKNIKNLDLLGDAQVENSMWVLITDLKFVCRY